MQVRNHFYQFVLAFRIQNLVQIFLHRGETLFIQFERIQTHLVDV